MQREEKSWLDEFFPPEAELVRLTNEQRLWRGQLRYKYYRVRVGLKSIYPNQPTVRRAHSHSSQAQAEQNLAMDSNDNDNNNNNNNNNSNSSTSTTTTNKTKPPAPTKTKTNTKEEAEEGELIDDNGNANGNVVLNEKEILLARAQKSFVFFFLLLFFFENVQGWILIFFRKTDFICLYWFLFLVF
jgi:hypothetical protein